MKKEGNAPGSHLESDKSSFSAGMTYNLILDPSCKAEFQGFLIIPALKSTDGSAAPGTYWRDTRGEYIWLLTGSICNTSGSIAVAQLFEAEK